MLLKLLSLFILITCFLGSCRKKASSWESDWIIPIVNDSLDLSHLINDSTLQINDAGYFELNLQRSLLDMRLLEIIKIPDTTLHENFAISLLNLNVSPGFAFVNSTEEHDFDLKDIELKKITLSSGKIYLTFKNPLPTKAYFHLKLPGVTLNGVEYETDYIAPAGTISNPGVVTHIIDISGYSLDLTGVTGGGFNKFLSRVTVQTDPNGPVINVTNKDTSRLSAEFKDFELSYARGYFGNQIIGDTTSFNFKPLSHIVGGNIDLPNTSISFNISNGMKIDASGTLNFIKNENLSTGQIVSLNNSNIGNPFNLSGATGTWDNLVPGLKNIQFNSMNSNVENYLENLGEKQNLAYKLQLNPWGNVSGGWNEIFSTSRLKVGLQIKMPLSFGLNKLTVTDTFAFSMKQDVQKTHILSGSFDLKYKNAFPFNAKISLRFLNESGGIIGSIEGTNSVESSLSSSVSSSNLLPEKVGQIQFIITNEIINQLENIKNIVVIAEFNTPNPISGLNEQVLIPGDAYLGLLLKASFKVENRFGK